MHIWNNTSGSNGSLAKTLVELFVVLDRQLNVARGNAVLLVVLCGVASKFKKLSCQVLKDCSTVNCRGGTNSGVGTYSALQESMNSTDWELFIINKNCLAKIECMITKTRSNHKEKKNFR